MKSIFLLLSIICLSFTVTAEETTNHDNLDLNYAHVVGVETAKIDATWTFSVAVVHGDSGWDHYADKWQILHPQTGEVLGERVLLHPHVNEQPFTRSLSGITIPDTVDLVIVRAGCNVHGFGGEELEVVLGN